VVSWFSLGPRPSPIPQGDFTGWSPFLSLSQHKKKLSENGMQNSTSHYNPITV